MVRFVHMADIHLGIEQYGKKERFRDFGRAFRDAIDFGLGRNVDFFLIAGDLFDKKSINPDTLLQAERVLSMAREKGIPVFACEGNHDTFRYGNQYSWLDYLSQRDLIRMLGPSPSGELVPWDGEVKQGSYFEGVFSGERVRIYGFGYLGSSTEKRIEIYSERIIRDDAVNIVMLHAGVEGYIDSMHGAINEDSLSVLRDKVDYLALGHIHKNYEKDDWFFNPGSLENWSLDETRYPHGLYLVDIKRNEDGHPEVRAKFEDWVAHRRPFYVWKIDVRGSASTEDVKRKVKSFLSEEGMPGTRKETSEVERPSPPSSSAAWMAGGGVTLDSFATQTGQQETDESSDENELTEDMRRPVVIARLRGKIETETPIDMEPVREFIQNSLTPEPLYVDVRDESSGNEFFVEEDAELPREVLELQVIRERLEQGEYSDFAGELTTLIYDMKRGFARKDSHEEFISRLKEIAEHIVEGKNSDDGMLTERSVRNKEK